jgi:hypothetical protein
MTMYDIDNAPKDTLVEINGKQYLCSKETYVLMEYESRRGSRYASHIFAVMLGEGRFEPYRPEDSPA